MSGGETSGMQSNPPTLAEVAAAMKVLQQDPDKGLSKHVSLVIVAAALGIGGWTIMGVSNLQTAVTDLSATVREMRSGIAAVVTQSNTGASQQADLRNIVIRNEQRIIQLERRLDDYDQRRGVQHAIPNLEGGG